jgi:exodeoxyribonuclease V alpha subunit
MHDLFSTFETSSGQIPFIDRAFGEAYGRSPSETLFLSYLFAATRSGYLSVEVDYDAIIPDPQDLYGPLSESASYGKQLIEGARSLDASLPVDQADGKFMIRRLFLAREIVLKEWKRLQDAIAYPPIDEQKLQLSALQSLTTEQKSAVEMACRSTPFILTGGPGTGKTFTAGKILQTLLSSTPPHSLRIVIAAPTGKAALHLEKTLKQITAEPIEAMTLHRLIQNKSSVLPYDLYLIDESSMIDLELMAKWLPKVKSSARVILLGDPHQLPPVECGSLFSELCLTHPHQVKLTKCLRAELSELVECAKELLQSSTFIPSAAVELHEDVRNPESILERHLAAFPSSATGISPELFAAFDRFRILSPLRKGAIGIEKINRYFLSKLYSQHQEGLFPVPLMLTTNDPKQRLFNGETGILLTNHSPFEPLTPDDQVYFPDERVIPALLLPGFEYAYAMTVHKSQGSEFDHVLLLLGDDPLSKKRELLYTAATRARKKLSVAFVL